MDTTVTSRDSGGDPPGTLIGPYKLVLQLGEGGMGVVYHAQQLHPIRRDVALKIIKPGMDSKQIIARFETERQALAVMDHANIARVFDAGATSIGLPYFVMEMVHGIPITRYCDAKTLSVRERVALFIPVCEAIQHAHQKGVIHRDIKPSNILIAEDEGKPVPKVIDFGLAKALGPQLGDASMTEVGVVVGTPNYMSPEQAELTRHDIDTRSDVYSLGAVLYELFTGTPPLRREHVSHAIYEVLQRVREEEPDRPSVRLRETTITVKMATQRASDPVKLPKLLHGELDWIVMKALEKDRTRRYATVTGLARDLQRYLDGEPVEAGPPSASYRLRKFAQKHRGWLATAAAFVALLVGGIVVSTSMAMRANRAEQEARAVNEFLQSDLLAQASANQQAGPGTKPDPDLKVRTALDRAAARVGGKFDRQPLVEAAIRHTIGITYRDLGLYSEAQAQLERAVELRRRGLGERQPPTLASRRELAVVYRRLGKYAEAEPLFASTMEDHLQVLGETHPDTLETMDSLAGLYREQGKYAQAVPLLIRAFDLKRRVHGAEHPETLVTMNNLALVYFSEGKYAEAEPLYTKGLEARRRISGDEHPETLTLLNNLGSLYYRQGDYAKAESVFDTLVDVRRRVLGAEHPSTLIGITNLAMTYRGQGDHARAEPLLTQTLEARRRVLGDDHPDTLRSMNILALLYADQRQYGRAESLLTTVVAVRRRVLGNEHPDTIGTANNLVKLYDDWGKPEKAAEWRTKP